MSADTRHDAPTTSLRLRLDRVQRPAPGRRRGRAWSSALAGWPDLARHRSSRPTWSAIVFWVGIALGCLGLTMLHHLVGGAWGLRDPPAAGGGGDDAPARGRSCSCRSPWACRTLYAWADPRRSQHDAVAPGQERVPERRLLPGPRRRSTSSSGSPWRSCSTGCRPRRTDASDHGAEPLAPARSAGRGWSSCS